MRRSATSSPCSTGTSRPGSIAPSAKHLLRGLASPEEFRAAISPGPDKLPAQVGQTAWVARADQQAIGNDRPQPKLHPPNRVSRKATGRRHIFLPAMFQPIPLPLRPLALDP